MSCEPADFQQVITTCKQSRNLLMGIKETVRSIVAGQAQLVFLASDVNEKQYLAVIESACNENKTPLIKVDSKTLLGQWCGLARIDEEGEVIKARACGTCSLKQIPAGPSGDKVREFIAANSA